MRSRRELVTAAGAAVLLAGCGGGEREPRRPAALDLAILHLALTFEYFAADFYDRLAAERLLESADQEIVSALREDEEQHVDALEELLKGLGGTRLPARPLPDFDMLLDGSAEAILARAAEIEDIAAATYLGQLPRVRDDQVLSRLLSIHSVEGRHAAGLNHRVGRSFSPEGALARPLDAGQARNRLAGLSL